MTKLFEELDCSDKIVDFTCANVINACRHRHSFFRLCHFFNREYFGGGSDRLRKALLQWILKDSLAIDLSENCRFISDVAGFLCHFFAVF